MGSNGYHDRVFAERPYRVGSRAPRAATSVTASAIAESGPAAADPPMRNYIQAARAEAWSASGFALVGGIVHRRYYSCISLLFLFGASGFADPPAVPGMDSVDTERLTLAGRVFIETIDDRRVLVAISTRVDGSSEHLFLYTATKPLSVRPNSRNWQATVYYETGGGLRVMPAGGDAQALEFVVSSRFESPGSEAAIVRFKQTLGLVHYVANPRVPIGDLEGLRKTNCNIAPKACVEVGDRFLPFPG